MILLHTTIYKPYGEILRAGPGPARPGARRGRNLALCGPWWRFPGSAAPIPTSPGFGLPGRSCAAWVWFRAFLVGNGDAGQLGRLAVGLPPGVQPVVFPPALSVDVRHGLGKPLFPAKPLFAAFQGARRWMRAQAVELPPARHAAPLVNSLAVGQHDCRRGSRRSRGNPAGVPRRRRRPTRSGGAKGAKRPEGRRARRALAAVRFGRDLCTSQAGFKSFNMF